MVIGMLWNHIHIVIVSHVEYLTFQLLVIIDLYNLMSCLHCDCFLRDLYNKSHNDGKAVPYNNMFPSSAQICKKVVGKLICQNEGISN